MKKNGFTLVEILIAISLIGVVAALTLPNMTRNLQVAELQAQFNKTYADLNDFAVYFKSRHSMTLPYWASMYGTDYQQKFIQYHSKTSATTGNIYTNMQTDEGKESLKKYTRRNLTNPNSGGSSSALCDASAYIEDNIGRIYSFDDNPPRGYNGPRVCVDINGAKKPNTWGLDVFSFLFTVDGSVIPEGEYNKFSNLYEEEYQSPDGKIKIGPAWSAQTTVGPSKCYAHYAGQTCAYYAAENKSPKDETKTYWKDFVGKKQYLK